MDIERKWRSAYNALILLTILAVICFVLKLWLILVFAIIGVTVMSIRLAFFTGAKKTMPQIKNKLPSLPQPETEQSILRKAFGLLQSRITQEVTNLYPDSSWIWEDPNAFLLFTDGYSLNILLNGAGGYRRARVKMAGLRFSGIVFETLRSEPRQTEVENDTSEPETAVEQEQAIDYSLIAFEWAEGNMLRLNERSNEMIASGVYELILAVDELPQCESWEEICKHLLRNGFLEADVISDGIRLKIPK